jgi:hypothetical protein
LELFRFPFSLHLNNKSGLVSSWGCHTYVWSPQLPLDVPCSTDVNFAEDEMDYRVLYTCLHSHRKYSTVYYDEYVRSITSADGKRSLHATAFFK